jgi:formate dehydrogenase subunit gamma
MLGSLPVIAEQGSRDNETTPIAVPNPSTDLWNAVRERTNMPLKTQVKSAESSVLINTSGEEWRLLRRDELIPKGGFVLLGALVVAGLFFLFKPAVQYADGESSKEIKRFDVAKRVSHWLMAVLMIFLGFTGLVLLFGRFVLLPWMGPDFFSALASASKEGHDLFGPLFTLSLILFFIHLVRRNLPGKGDIKWLLHFGGLFTTKHLPAGFFNAGEKMLFWLVIVFGAALSVSGFAILFQNLIPGRDLMQLAIFVHAVAAILLICVVFGHIYMAISFKGTLQSMATGKVDANWARDHHRYWYEQMEESGEVKEKTVTKSEGGLPSEASVQG